jgi:hypothetical protein
MGFDINITQRLVYCYPGSLPPYYCALGDRGGQVEQVNIDVHACPVIPCDPTVFPAKAIPYEAIVLPVIAYRARVLWGKE